MLVYRHMAPQEIQEINKLRDLFPNEISVNVSRGENGEFLAKINTFKGIYTEGKTFLELMEMINDAVKTYFEVPEKYLSYMPSYIPPISLAQFFEEFPATDKQEDVKLPLSTREKVSC
jgi:predicted RNase H-like HicB family nuclease